MFNLEAKQKIIANFYVVNIILYNLFYLLHDSRKFHNKFNNTN